jgi:hypothetical protein
MLHDLNHFIRAHLCYPWCLAGALALLPPDPLYAETVTATGTIEAVDAAARTITVRRKTANGEKTAKLAVGPKAEVTDDGQSRDLTSLKAGQEVTITYDKAAKQVTGISVRTASSPSAGDRAHGADPPGDATTFEGHSYKFFREVMSWHQAKRRCEELGGHLAIVGSDAENDFIMALAKSGVGNLGKQNGVWLGATDEAKEGDWRWIDGSRLRFTNWLQNPKQPNNSGGDEHYLWMWLVQGGAWTDQADQPKEMTAYFVCEWDASLPDRATKSMPGLIELKPLVSFSGDLRGPSVAETKRVKIVESEVGKAAQFDGKAWIKLKGILPAARSPRSLAAWIKNTRGPTDELIHVLQYGEMESKQIFGIIQAGRHWRFFDLAGGLDTEIDVDTDWHHHCITYDGEKITYYFDGNAVAEVARELNTVNTLMLLGAHYELGLQPEKRSYIGLIANFVIYDRALTGSDVKTLIDGGDMAPSEQK